MTRLWEQNKPLVLVLGVCLLLLVVVRPTVFGMGPPLARWMGLGWKSDYDAQVDKYAQACKDLKQFNPDWAPGIETLDPKYERMLEELNRNRPVGHPQTIAALEARIGMGNKALKQNFDDYVHALVFIPYRPFIAPAGDPDPGHYFIKLLTQTQNALLQYCSLRFVQVAPDLGFGEFREGKVPTMDRVPALLRELAVVDTFVRQCADAQVEFTTIVSFGNRTQGGTELRSFLWEYPLQVKLRAGYRELTRLLTALNGLHATVTSTVYDDTRKTVESVRLDRGRVHGVHRDDQFTIFKRPADKPCALRYAGRVVVTGVSETECDAKVVEDSLPYERLDTAREEADRIQRNDLASTGFFRIIRIDARGIPGVIESSDAEGIPTKVTLPVLDVTLDLATFGFDPDTEYVTEQNAKGVVKLPGLTTQKPPTIPTTGSGVPTTGGTGAGPARRSF